MKPIKFVALWLAQLVSHFIIFMVLFLSVPELWLFGHYNEHFGFIEENDWNNIYMLGLFILSIVINALLILVVSSFAQRRL